MITEAQLKKIAPAATQANIVKFTPLINATLQKYSINTHLRVAHFLAQVLHESGSLRYNEEIASGAKYEGRRDLGNVAPGDGVKFKGRGLIQLTGRANYKAYGVYLGEHLEKFPELVAGKYAADVAGWYWKTKNINELADKDDLQAVTKRVNGGLNGFNDRLSFLVRAKQVLSV